MIRFELGREGKSDAYVNLVECYIKDLKNDYSSDIEGIIFRPVERVGWSSADVFYIDIKLININQKIKRVGKFVPPKDGEIEKNSAQLFKFADYRDAEINYYINNEYSLIIYQKVEDAKEFRYCYLDKDNCSDAKCSDFIRQLYKNSVSKYIEVTTEDNENNYISIIDDYRDYIENRSIKPLDKLKSSVDFFEQSLTYGACNPYTFYVNEFKPTKWGQRPVKKYLVHGDLHARNIMRKNDEAPRVIDFAWGHFGHRMKDFTLLEATIKYMLLSEYCFKNYKKYIPHEVYLGFEKQLCVEGMNLSQYTINNSESFSRSGDKDIDSALQRAFTCIKEIRECASFYLSLTKNCNNRRVKHMDNQEFESNKEEYFTSLFLISLGNIAFPDTQENWTLHGCGLLVPEIKKHWS